MNNGTFSFYIYTTKSRLYRFFQNCDTQVSEDWTALINRLPRVEGSDSFVLFRKTGEIIACFDEFIKKYKTTIPEIQKVSSFLKKVDDGDYFYYLDGDTPFLNHFCCAHELPLIDDLKKRSVLHNRLISHYGPLLSKFQIFDFGFFENLGFLYGNKKDGNEKIRVGENKKQTCRFCHKDYTERTFKKIAHAIPESLGNDLLFCNEECDSCNEKLERTVESNLINYLDFNRALLEIENKERKIPEIEGDNFYVRRDSNGHPVLCVVENVDSKAMQKKEDVRLEHRKVISDNGIYKALCKIVIDLMPSDKLHHFQETINWINGIVYGQQYPSIYWRYTNNRIKQPYALLFLNEHRHPETPYCTSLLAVCNMLFLFVVPYIDIDGGKYKKDEKLDNHWNLFLRTFNGIWQKMNLSKDTPSIPHYDLDLSNSVFVPFSDKESAGVDIQERLKPHIRKNKREYVEFSEITNNIFSKRPSVENIKIDIFNEDSFEGKPETGLSYNIGGKIHIFSDRSECMVEAFIFAKDTTNTISFFDVRLSCRFKLTIFSEHIELTDISFAFDYKLRDFLWYCTLRLGDDMFSKKIDSSKYKGIRLVNLFDENHLFFLQYYIYENNNLAIVLEDKDIHSV